MANKRGGGTRLVIEKGAQSAGDAEAAADDVERRESKLAELIGRLGGKGRAKVYRLMEGEPQYATSWPVDADLADNLEERLAELGGGKYAVKLYWGSKCEASLQFSVDALSHPMKKTDAELRREGGILPQSPAELAAFVSQTVTSSLAPFLSAMQQQPRNDGRDDLVKLMLLNSQQQAAEARELNAKLLDGLFSRSNAPAAGAGDPKTMLRDLAETVTLVDNIRGDGPSRDPRADKRDLGARLIEGPMTKAAERMADKVVDKFFTEDDDEKKPKKAPVAATAQQQPQQQPAQRPAQLPTKAPTTPVTMPRGVKPLAPADLARLRMKPTSTPAPRAADAVPAAVTNKG